METTKVETVNNILTAAWFDRHDRACVALGVCPECASEFAREGHEAGCSLAPESEERAAEEPTRKMRREEIAEALSALRGAP